MPLFPQDLCRADGDAKGAKLPAAPSLFLDVIRLGAALTVAVGHLSQGYFTTGWPPILMDYAHGAVAVFFVLSGFMIRYITHVKLGDLWSYSVDRITRIYSVVLPALALTVVFDLISANLKPGYYATNFSELGRRGLSPVTAASLLKGAFWLKSLVRVALSAAMLSQSWFRDSSPLSNSPFWSVCYECVFYALFGITLYLRGRKRLVALAAVFVLIGPTVILMYPLWLLGCASYEAFDRGMFHTRTLLKLSWLSALSLVVVYGVPWFVRHTGLSWFYVGRAVSPMATTAIATALVLPAACRMLAGVPVDEASIFVRLTRKAAAATFPLYLIHFPLFVLFAAAVPYPRGSLLIKGVFLSAVFATSVLLAGPCDHLKEALRRRMLSHRRREGSNQPVLERLR